MTDDAGLEVHGGVGGTSVGIDELVTAAGHLGQAARDLGELVAGLVAVSAEVAASSPLSPVTAVRAEVELVRAARSLALEAAAVAGVATSVRSAAWAYRAVEEEVVRTAALAQDVVMAVAGHGAPSLVVAVVALDAVGVDVGALVDRAVWEVPEVAELAGGSGGLVVGLRLNPLTAPFVVPSQTGPSGPGRADEGDQGDEGDGGGRDGDGGEGDGGEADDDHVHNYGGGVVGVDADEAAVGVLADSAALWGLLSEQGAVQVTAVQDVGADPGVPVRPAALHGVADLAQDQTALPRDGRVRVVEVRGEQGPAWVVEIAGTQSWDARAGSNPFDLTTDVRSMAAESTLLAAGVEQALAAAQSRAAATSGGTRDVAAEPVLLSGHSLGGIVAAGLASSAQFRSAHRVTHVVAMGSPIGKVPVPPGVQVLAVEHRQDPVPRLEGRANPDRASWVTVSRDLEDVPGIDERAGAAHRSERYVETAAAVDASDDRSVRAWRTSAGAFFSAPGDGTEVAVRDYRIARMGPSP
ncbi:hypothetical protein GCM10009867_14920 [Pedococcus aerophilus]|uniref:Fungal lipase-like domain-containing protein n=1 Tax=Pedococcus aerophilus TaxID=436356 RepID=A0ABN3UMC1_9MICO